MLSKIIRHSYGGGFSLPINNYTMSHTSSATAATNPTLFQLQSNLLGKEVTYRGFDLDYELPPIDSHVSSIEEFGGGLRIYIIKFSNPKIPSHTISHETAKKINFNERFIVFKPYYFESHGTTTWAIDTQSKIAEV